MLGILLMAVFYNRKNFLWSKYFSDRRSRDDREKGGRNTIVGEKVEIRDK